MLQLFNSTRNLDFSQLRQVYAQDADDFFYEDALDFLAEEGCCYAVWVVDGRYKSALRWQPFRDGFLVAGIESNPTDRRKGYAQSLLSAVLNRFACDGSTKVYSHIHKDNLESIRLHQRCGFVQIKDSAVLLDGSASNHYFTFQVKI